MPLPPFLLVEDSYAEVQAFVHLVKRIGIANAVRPVGSIEDAQRYLATCDPSQLPVVVLAAVPAHEQRSDEEALFAWMEEQEPPVSAIPTVTLVKPLEMYALIGALKALALPERARIDTTTLMVRVELWPHGTIVADA